MSKPLGLTALPKDYANVTAVYLANPATQLACPVYETGVTAGFPSPAADYIEESLDLNELLIRHKVATFFTRVRGDSMIGAGIYHRDLLVVDRAEQVRDKHIVFARVGNEFCIKEIRILPNEVRLCSANRKYRDLIITQEMEFEVWGRVTYSITKH